MAIIAMTTKSSTKVNAVGREELTSDYSADKFDVAIVFLGSSDIPCPPHETLL